MNSNVICISESVHINIQYKSQTVLCPSFRQILKTCLCCKMFTRDNLTKFSDAKHANNAGFIATETIIIFL